LQSLAEIARDPAEAIAAIDGRRIVLAYSTSNFIADFAEDARHRGALSGAAPSCRLFFALGYRVA
jgi:hypothetical protein